MKIKSFECPKYKPTTHCFIFNLSNLSDAWSMRRSTQQPIVLLWRLSDFSTSVLCLSQREVHKSEWTSLDLTLCFNITPRTRFRILYVQCVSSTIPSTVYISTTYWSIFFDLVSKNLRYTGIICQPRPTPPPPPHKGLYLPKRFINILSGSMSLIWN